MTEPTDTTSTEPAPQPATSAAADLLATLRSQGATWTSIAAAVGRDTRLLYYVANGDKPGHNLIQALTELVDTGEVRNPPPRRQTRRGQRARVRGPEGTTLIPAPVRPVTRPRQRTGQRPGAGGRPRLTAQEYVHQLLQRGLTIGQIAQRIGAHPSTVRNIDRGTSAGTRWTDALLRTTRSTRRRQVRSTEQPTATIVREPPPEQTREQHLRNPRTGREFHRQSLDPDQRDATERSIRDTFQRAAGNRRRVDGMVYVNVAGRRDPLAVRIGGKGGYDAANIMAGIEHEGGALDWLYVQVEGRYPELDPGSDEWEVIGMDINVW